MMMRNAQDSFHNPVEQGVWNSFLASGTDRQRICAIRDDCQVACWLPVAFDPPLVSPLLLIEPTDLEADQGNIAAGSVSS
jgi:hypothetical protein